MFELFNNGKVIITPTHVTIKETFSTKNYSRHQIKGITYFAGLLRIFTILLNIILFWGIFRAIKMAFYIRVHINLYNGRHHSFYVTTAEYKQIKNIF